MMTASILPERRLARSRSCKKRSNLLQEIHESPPNLKRTRTMSSTAIKKDKVYSSDCSERTSTSVNGKLAFMHDRQQTAANEKTGASDELVRDIGTAASEQSTKKKRGRPRKVNVNNEPDVATGIGATTKKMMARDVQDVRNGKDEKTRNNRAVYEGGISLDVTLANFDMWTCKYAPSSFGTFVGNTAAVATVENWLQRWMNRPMKAASTYNDSSSSDQYAEDELSNSILIKGPPGVGKTALVYYAAQRLGYTVLEMNSSSERSGRRVLADLQEATQSLHVEGTKVSSAKGIGSFFKPAFKSEPTAPCRADIQKQTQERPGNRKSKGRTSTKESTTSNNNSKGTISFFFSSSLKGRKDNTENPHEVLEILDESCSSSPGEISETAEKATAAQSKSSIKSFFKSVDKSEKYREAFRSQRVEQPDNQVMDTRSRSGSPEGDNSQRIKCSKSTIILFDDVDVVFDEDGDEGFWMALDTVLRNSKKPCILTATRGYDSIVKRCRILQDTPVIELHRPSPTQVAGLLRKVGALENRDLTDYNADFMCQYLSSDVRRALLQMEFDTISPGLPQAIHPVDKTLGALFLSGCLEDAVSIQTTFTRSGFNAFYSALESCLPFEFEDIVMRKPLDPPATSSPETNSTPFRFEAKRNRGSDRKRMTRTATKTTTPSLHSAMLSNLAEIFDQLSQCDLFAGTLDTMGEQCLLNYERAKRWMEQRPIEARDANPRAIEELLEIGSTALLGGVAKPLQRISERCEALSESEQKQLHLPRVSSSLGFRDIHKKLKKVRTNERALGDILSLLPIRRPLAKHYLFYLSRICQAEEERRGGPNTKRHKRFLHYLPQIKLYLTPDQIERIATLWA